MDRAGPGAVSPSLPVPLFQVSRRLPPWPSGRNSPRRIASVCRNRPPRHRCAMSFAIAVRVRRYGFLTSPRSMRAISFAVKPGKSLWRRPFCKRSRRQLSSLYEKLVRRTFARSDYEADPRWIVTAIVKNCINTGSVPKTDSSVKPPRCSWSAMLRWPFRQLFALSTEVLERDRTTDRHGRSGNGGGGGVNTPHQPWILPARYGTIQSPSAATRSPAGSTKRTRYPPFEAKRWPGASPSRV